MVSVTNKMGILSFIPIQQTYLLGSNPHLPKAILFFHFMWSVKFLDKTYIYMRKHSDVFKYVSE